MSKTLSLSEKKKMFHVKHFLKGEVTPSPFIIYL